MWSGSTFVFIVVVVGAAACGQQGSGAGAGGAGGAEEPGTPAPADAGSARPVGPDGSVAADAAVARQDGSAAVPPAMPDAAPPAPDAAPAADSVAPPAGDSILWAIDNTRSIGGFTPMVLGAPAVIDTPAGKALQFDGNDDALFIEHHPLAGWSQLTAEIIFRPDPGGAEAQRFFHMQDSGSGGRVLFETRLTGGNWFGDVFVESKSGSAAVFSAGKLHPLGAWYHLAVVIDGKRAHYYVNGVEDAAVNLGYTAHGPGRTAIGVRINEKYFFKGAIRVARFTPRALTPAEFLPR
jgi:hypothetical protein